MRGMSSLDDLIGDGWIPADVSNEEFGHLVADLSCLGACQEQNDLDHVLESGCRARVSAQSADRIAKPDGCHFLTAIPIAFAK